VKEEELSNLIPSVYDAALNPTDWPRAAQMFARAFDTESCAIFQLNLVQGSAGIAGITENFDAKAIDVARPQKLIKVHIATISSM
jgi:hypothetical protein